MGIRNFNEFIHTFIRWEHDFHLFYEKLDQVLDNEKCEVAITAIKKRQRGFCEILTKINIDDFSDMEYIRNFPEQGFLNPLSDIRELKGQSVQDVFKVVLSYEQKIESFYCYIRNVLIYIKSKELLDQLIEFRKEQILEIKSLMTQHDLVC